VEKFHTSTWLEWHQRVSGFDVLAYMPLFGAAQSLARLTIFVYGVIGLYGILKTRTKLDGCSSF
jgi:uncharacterized membrane protein YuzA (DUF378 family)